jgi:hypothetical protein
MADSPSKDSGAAADIEHLVAGLDLREVRNGRCPLPEQRRNEQRLVSSRSVDLGLQSSGTHALLLAL